MLADFNDHPNPEPMSLIFLDVDHFKNINDTYLHLTGDQVLIGLAKLLQSEMYSSETIGRYGGEEFIVVCPSTDLKQAIAKAERLRLAICDATLCDVQKNESDRFVRSHRDRTWGHSQRNLRPGG